MSWEPDKVEFSIFVCIKTQTEKKNSSPFHVYSSGDKALKYKNVTAEEEDQQVFASSDDEKYLAVKKRKYSY